MRLSIIVYCCYARYSTSIAMFVPRFVFRPHRLQAVNEMRPTATDVARSVVWVFVCLLITFVSPAKTAEATRMPFGAYSYESKEPRVAWGSRSPHEKGHFLRGRVPARCNVLTSEYIAPAACLLITRSGRMHFPPRSMTRQDGDAASYLFTLDTC